jgi:hypothetical protein
MLEHLEGRVVLSTITVTSAADAGSGSLRAAIAKAQSGDTINFSAKLDGKTIHLSSGELAIAQSLTIAGPGAGSLDIDAGGTSRVFDITSATAAVTISGLSISGGASENGGGIFDQGGALCLSGDTLDKDQAIGLNPGDTVSGGAIDVTDNGSLSASGCAFRSDVAQGAAGANGPTGVNSGAGGNGNGGAIFADNGTSLNVAGCTFLANQANGGVGGSGGTAVGSGFGGTSDGSSIDALGSSLSVTDSTFALDVGQGGAGGVGLGPYDFNGYGGYANGSINVQSPSTTTTFDFSGDSFTGELAIGGAGVAGGSGGAVSGGINNNYSLPPISISNCTFSANVVRGGAGSAGASGNEGGSGGFAGGSAVYTGGDLTITGSTFTGNQEIGGAGAVGGAGAGGG